LTQDVKRLAVTGTGVMGSGIAQIAAQAGIAVQLFDAQPGAAQKCKATLETTLARLVEKNKLSAAQRDAAVANLSVAAELSELAACDVVIEAVVERLEIKRELFRQLETIVSPECVLATNTSSLSVTAIAAACERPQRVAGYHFFNPVPLMRIVEVIDGLLTDAVVVDTLMTLAKRLGHTAVRCKDTPGFIVNHAGRGFGTEALRILGEGIAAFHDIDAILRGAAGFRMGPFELMDLTGIDVSHPVMESIYAQYYQEPRYRPSPILANRVAGGLLGRKVGRGFYEYTNGERSKVGPAPVSGVRPQRVWVSHARAPASEQVRALVAKLGVPLDAGLSPHANSLCVVTPLGDDATTQVLVENLDARRTVAIDTLFGLERHRTVMATPLTSPEMRTAAHGLFGADGVGVSMINDSPGFVAQRVVAMIVNIGCDIAQQRIADPQDIDRAVTLGLGYPNGPLAMGDALGAQTILNILEALQKFYGDPRYRPSPWLKRRALLGAPLLTAEP
jgi:3-hydroxybutyryl-CoA dehydrogenase